MKMFSTRTLFRIESVIFTLMGLNYLLFPTINAENVFGPGLYSFIVKPNVLSSLSTSIQSMGGACILIATLFCGAACSGPTHYMAKAVASGHAINALLHGYHYMSVGGLATYTSANLVPMFCHGLFAVLACMSYADSHRCECVGCDTPTCQCVHHEAYPRQIDRQGGPSSYRQGAIGRDLREAERASDRAEREAREARDAAAKRS